MAQSGGAAQPPPGAAPANYAATVTATSNSRLIMTDALFAAAANDLVLRWE